MFGAGVSLYVGVMATLGGTLIGSVLGLISAFWGGRVDNLIQRTMDMLLAFPALILALSIMTVLGASITNVIIAICITFVPKASRVIGSKALAIRETAYVEAARAIGCSSQRIILRHIVPNCWAPFLVLASALLGQAIIAEASLSFLGLGVPPPTPSWGRSLSEGIPYMKLSSWLVISPGIAISLVVFGVNLLADGLRDALDPKLRLT